LLKKNQRKKAKKALKERKKKMNGRIAKLQHTPLGAEEA